jgi:hypothetical protein
MMSSAKVKMSAEKFFQRVSDLEVDGIQKIELLEPCTCGSENCDLENYAILIKLQNTKKGGIRFRKNLLDFYEIFDELLDIQLDSGIEGRHLVRVRGLVDRVTFDLVFIF